MNCFLNFTAVLLLCGLSAAAQRDSYYVRHFNSENGLPQNSIKGIESDREGYLWLSTEMGIVRYDGERFRIYDQINTPAMQADRIVTMGLINDTSIYFEGDDGKYYLIETGKPIRDLNPDPKTKKHLDSTSIYKAYDLFERCKQKIDNKKLPAWALPDRRAITRSLLNSVSYTHGRYFYFNDHRELISVDASLSLATKHILDGQLDSTLNAGDHNDKPVSLLLSNGQLYVRYDQWIYHLVLTDFDRLTKCEPLLRVGDIANVSCLKVVPQMNMIYVGTLSDGFYLFQKQFFSTLQFADIESNVFYAQARYGSDGVLTKKGVLSPNHVAPIAISGITSESLLQTKDGNYFVNIWRSRQESGIAELNKDLEMIRYMPDSDMRVNCFRQLKDGSIWFGGDKYFLGRVEKEGLVYMNRPRGLPADFLVRCFLQTNDDSIWIGGVQGLARMDVAAKHASVIPELSGMLIRTLYQDKRGTIWIGSYGKGYFAWYKNHLVHLPVDRNNYLATTHSFMEDKAGFLWITTNVGLFQASIKDLYDYLDNPKFSLYYQYYDQSAGFLTNEFNGGCSPSAIELSNGRFSFPSMKSLVQFYPDSIVPVLPNGAIHLDAITADTTLINYVTDSVNFSTDIKHINFFISSPYFGNAYNQEIEYKIDDLDNNWYAIDEDGVIKINKPTTGHYKLLLRKKSGFGKDKYVYKAVSFFIEPHFSETYYFRVLWILLFFGLGYLLYRVRVGFLLKQKAILEKEVSERTQEQEYLIENLENTIRELEDSKEESYQNNLFKQKLAIIITHDLQSPLRFQLDAMRRIHKKSLQKQYGDVASTSEVLIKSTEEIYHFVEDFGLWLSSMDKNFHMQQETLNLDGLLTDLEHFFSEQLKAKDNKLFFQTYKPVFVYTDWHLLKIILRNIIDNANKHTFHGIIEISARASDGSGMIIIKDNGKGISSDLLDKINQRLKQKTTDYKERESGYGYRFIIDFSRLLNIRVNIESELGKGTTITLSNFKMTNA